MSPTQTKKSPQQPDRHYLADRAEARADMLSNGEDEISEVIDTRALELQRQRQSAPPSGFAKLASPAVAVLRAITGPYQLLGLALLVAAFIAWLRLRP
jgi:hypothetical protein